METNKKINLVLPIAGLGKRFADEGYEKPKPLIKFKDDITILQRSLQSVDIKSCNLIFIVQQAHCDQWNIDNFITKNYPDSIIIKIDGQTEGALCTVMKAENYFKNDNPLCIFTPDCYFEPKIYPQKIKDDGLVCTFTSTSPAHSYVKLNKQNYITEVKEKEVISNDAIGGFYYWKTGNKFYNYAKQSIENNDRTKNEFYIAPVFNYLLNDGGLISIDRNTYHEILGTPKDLKEYQ